MEFLARVEFVCLQPTMLNMASLRPTNSTRQMDPDGHSQSAFAKRPVYL